MKLYAVKLYAVKNDTGELWDFDDEYWGTNADGNYTAYKWAAKITAHDHGGHVVELEEKPELVEVSEEEAKELLMTVTGEKTLFGLLLGTDEGSYDRIARAYVNGWIVKKPKRWIVKVPHTDDSYFYKIDDEYCNAGDSYHLEGMTDKKWFTLTEIEHYGLGGYEKVEVKDD